MDVEDELYRDDAARVFTYRASLEPASAYPCDDYTGHIKVWSLPDGGSGLVWSGQMTPSEPGDRAKSVAVTSMMAELYEASLDGLIRRFGGRRA